MDEHIFLSSTVLWSQIDANRHLRHSAYADFAAQARLEMMVAFGFEDALLAEWEIGPILFREETIYHQEITLSEKIQVSCVLKRCREDGARWTFEQQILKQNKRLAATITVDGAWIHLQKRKIVVPPKIVAESFLNRVPHATDFILDPIPIK